MRAAILILVFLAVLRFDARAQGTSTGLGFLDLPYSARTAALGESTVADHSDPLSVLLNPALVHGITGLSLSVSHQQWIQNVRSNLLQAALPLSFASVAFTIAATSIPGIEVRTVPGPPEGTFAARSAIMAVTAAFPVDDDLVIGGSLMHCYEKIYVDDATALLLDVGMRYQTPLDGLSAGASLQRVGSVSPFRSERPSAPTRFRLGGAYQLDISELTLLGSAGISTGSVEAGTRFHLGVEGRYLSLIAVRAGYQSSTWSRGFSAGLGLTYSALTFDYGFVPFSFGLGSGHLITLGAAL